MKKEAISLESAYIQLKLHELTKFSVKFDWLPYPVISRGILAQTTDAATKDREKRPNNFNPF